MVHLVVVVSLFRGLKAPSSDDLPSPATKETIQHQAIFILLLVPPRRHGSLFKKKVTREEECMGVKLHVFNEAIRQFVLFFADPAAEVCDCSWAIFRVDVQAVVQEKDMIRKGL
ncbi:hypothetical protein [Kyrpidia tusciae]|uniref:Uncharacterized protein n=1 Tax=Kyrpidia tusciae (strain DSM 2912 / NBRC 15312 / T2) TaxID=562970 RepID=D5WS98_KYRT2|nr:hypothetical protein [Kyrpidia tusciae]ADG04983.1 hypothetical protein Btus_0206 [Kyrpidia tusciae DSM 2912]